MSATSPRPPAVALRRGPGRDLLLLTLPGATFRLGRSSVLLTGAASIAALVVAAFSLTLGVYPIDLADVLRVLGGGGTPIDREIVVGDRLPRALTGLGVGAGFALSGAILQRIAGNPLVSPDVIGINSGAALGALTALLVFGAGGAAVALGALVGALLTATAILVLAYRRGLQGFRLVLVGIGVAAMATSAISYLLTRAEINRAMSAAAWLTGSLANRSGYHAALIGAALLAAAPVVLVLSRHLRLRELGDDLARTLSGTGSRPTLVLLFVAVAVAALATAASGPIGFVALVAPQVARRLLAERQIGLAPSAALGALLVVSADLAGRLIFAPSGMPVGVITAVIGAPALLYLLARAQRIGAAG